MGKTELKELEELCNKLGVKIRYEKTNARGGLCRVNGENIIIIDKKATDYYKQTIICKAVKSFDLSNIHIKPKIRELIEDIV